MPSFADGLFFLKMTVERIHQVHKRCLVKNDSSSSHISTMEYVISTDWFRKPHDIWFIREVCEEIILAQAAISLSRLLNGRKKPPL